MNPLLFLSQSGSFRVLFFSVEYFFYLMPCILTLFSNLVYVQFAVFHRVYDLFQLMDILFIRYFFFHLMIDLIVPFSSFVTISSPGFSVFGSCTDLPFSRVMLYPLLSSRCGFTASIFCSSICRRCCSAVSILAVAVGRFPCSMSR